MNTSADQGEALTALAVRASDGDRAALELLCKELQDPIYRLALRMFSRPADAADATQEALVAIVTNLGSFEGRSKLLTWAYTVASRRFLRMKRKPVEETVADSATFAAWLDAYRSEPGADVSGSAEFYELCAEVRIGCTYGMLLCLGREQRIAYLLGDVIGFTDVEGANACGVSAATFRQRLSRSRRTMRDLMADRCGLVRSDNPCRCGQLVEASVTRGLANPDDLIYARHPGVQKISTETVARAAAELDAAVAISEVFRSDPEWTAPEQVWAQLRDALPNLVG